MSSAGSSHILGCDPRHWQIAALTVLVLYSLAFLDFGATIPATATALGSALAAQFACSRVWRRGAFEWRSALITGLSLSLLLRSADLPIMALAAAAGIASKFLLRMGDRHLFNPAACGIVVVLLGTGDAWVSPGQWGASAWIVSLVLLLAAAVLSHAPRVDTALAFLASYLGLLLVRARWLGDPAAIPLHQMMSGSLLVFAFFMITDPRTTPASRTGRVLFAAIVALLAHALAFYGQVRPALYFALLLCAPVVVLIDRVLPRAAFVWTSPRPALETAP